jgi:hypothetical protein
MFKLNADVAETYTFHFRCDSNEDAEKLAKELEQKVENYNHVEADHEVVILYTAIDEMGETFPATDKHPELVLQEPQYYFDQTLEVANNSDININFTKTIIC